MFAVGEGGAQCRPRSAAPDRSDYGNHLTRSVPRAYSAGTRWTIACGTEVRFGVGARHHCVSDYCRSVLEWVEQAVCPGRPLAARNLGSTRTKTFARSVICG